MRAGPRAAGKIPLGPVIVGGILAALTFAVPKLAVSSSVPFVAAVQKVAMGIVAPGIVGASMAVRNIHAAPIWIAAVGNFVLYFGMLWIMVAVWRTARRH